MVRNNQILHGDQTRCEENLCMVGHECWSTICLRKVTFLSLNSFCTAVILTISPLWLILLINKNLLDSNTSLLYRKQMVYFCSHCQMKKCSEETQTLRAGCSKAEPKNFAPPQTSLSGGVGWPKFNQLEMITTFTNKPSMVKIDACNFELPW